MILSSEFLKNESRKRNISFSNKTDILNESIEIASASGTFDIFISHSYRDKVEILTLMKLLSDAGYSSYVDWIEHPELSRDNITTNTADILRNDIEKCQSLAYIVSDNIINSKWCPWELGYADGHLNHKCCILPIMQQAGSDNFNGQEYLGLYPYIKYDKRADIDMMDFWIHDPSNNGLYTHLRDWIEKDKPNFHK